MGAVFVAVFILVFIPLYKVELMFLMRLLARIADTTKKEEKEAVDVERLMANLKQKYLASKTSSAKEEVIDEFLSQTSKKKSGWLVKYFGMDSENKMEAFRKKIREEEVQKEGDENES